MVFRKAAAEARQLANEMAARAGYIAGPMALASLTSGLILSKMGWFSVEFVT